MAKIIMFGNQKGGVGKSQVSQMLATALTAAPFNLNVCIIDLDGQKSIVNSRSVDLLGYGAAADAVKLFDVIDLEFTAFQKQISKIDNQYDIIILDVAGKLDNKAAIEVQEITKALMYVDFLFMPFVAGNHNISATLQYFTFVRQVQSIRQLQPRRLHVFGFVNMFRQRSRSNAFLTEDIKQLTAVEPLLMMQTPLGEYAAFRDADTVQSLYDANTNDVAKTNFTLFVNELTNLIK